MRRVAAVLVCCALVTPAGCFIAPEIDVPDGVDGGAAAVAGGDAKPGKPSKPAGASTVVWTWGTTTDPSPCAVAPTIDGIIGGKANKGRDDEWACAGTATGIYGKVHALTIGTWLYVANDWRLRTDGPICPGMYNAFWISTIAGMLSVKVYGDQHIEAEFNGERLDKAQGASGFGPSDNLAQPHAMWEFAVDLAGKVPPLPMQLTEHDPGTNFVTFVPATVDGIPQCPADAAPMVDEPTAFALVPQQSDGGHGMQVTLLPDDALIITGVEPWPLIPGQPAIARGAGLVAGPDARVRLGTAETEVSAWLGNCVIFRVPADAHGESELQVRRGDGKATSTQVAVGSAVAP